MPYVLFVNVKATLQYLQSAFFFFKFDLTFYGSISNRRLDICLHRCCPEPIALLARSQEIKWSD